MPVESYHTEETEEYDAESQRDDDLYMGIKRYMLAEGCPKSMAHKVALRVSQLVMGLAQDYATATPHVASLLMGAVNCEDTMTGHSWGHANDDNVSQCIHCGTTKQWAESS